MKPAILTLELLAPLLDSRPRTDIVRYGNMETGGWMCTGCGVRVKQLMIRKHRRECPWKAHYTAIETLRNMLMLPLSRPNSGKEKRS